MKRNKLGLKFKLSNKNELKLILIDLVAFEFAQLIKLIIQLKLLLLSVIKISLCLIYL